MCLSLQCGEYVDNAVNAGHEDNSENAENVDNAENVEHVMFSIFHIFIFPCFSFSSFSVFFCFFIFLLVLFSSVSRSFSSLQFRFLSRENRNYVFFLTCFPSVALHMWATVIGTDLVAYQHGDVQVWPKHA